MSSNRFQVIDDIETVQIRIASPRVALGDAKKTEALWEALKTDKPQLFNGTIYYLDDFVRDEKTLSLNAVPTEYKYYATGQLCDVTRDVRYVLAVTGITYYRRHGSLWFLFGIRSDQCFLDSKRIEFVPSGSIDDKACQENMLSYAVQLKHELYEETGIGENEILSLNPWTLIFDKEGCTADLCCLLEIMDPVLSQASSEYEGFIEVEQSSLTAFDDENNERFSPLTALLLNRLKQTQLD